MNGITRYSPLSSELTRFDPLWNIDDMFNNFMMRPFSFSREGTEMDPQIKMDVKEADGKYLVNAEIPGVTKNDIHVSVDGNRVSISAEVKQEKASVLFAANAVTAWPHAALPLPTKLIKTRFRPNTTTACLNSRCPRSRGLHARKSPFHEMMRRRS